MPRAELPLRVAVIDSHTAGEPTRSVLDGLPDLGNGPLAERLEHLRRHHDHYRRAILCEPRGSDVLVGAYLIEPVNPAAAAGVLFFNNAGYLGMCGHGAIGVAVTLAHLGRIEPGTHSLETPVGTVAFELHPGNRVTIRNVPAYRYRAAVTVDVPGHGPITGDVAWGGNWFFLVGSHPFRLALDQVEPLTAFTWKIRPTTRPITAATSSSVPATPTTALPAAPEPAPSLPAWLPTATCSPVNPGVKREFSAPSSKAVIITSIRPAPPKRQRLFLRSPARPTSQLKAL